MPFMRRSNRFVFQQDNARPHIVRLSVNFLQTNNVNTLPRPSRSPDLAPIEHVSDMLNRRIREVIIHSTLCRNWKMRSSLNGTPFNSTRSTKSSEACKKDLELPLLPTGLGQDTDIVDFCVNPSFITCCIP